MSHPPGAALRRRLAQTILDRSTVTGDDYTADGDWTVDPNRRQGGPQSRIGPVFRWAIAEGLLDREPVGSVLSRTPSRHAARIPVWLVTPKGRQWAREILALPEQP